MALTAIGAAAGTVALGAYLDARFHIRNDIHKGSLKRRAAEATNFIAERTKAGKLFLYNVFEDRAGTPEGDALFLVFEGRQWTYTEFFNALQPVGNWLMKDLGVQKGEMVALDGGNSAEYLMLVFALEAIGAKTALINCNLTAQPLVHCVQLSGARYVLADAGLRPLDRGHNVKVAWGNGMRPDIWEPFRERFGIDCIYELYAASDGMLQSLNANRGPFSRNAIAVRGPLWHWWNGQDEKRVRVDPDTQEILRGADGYAIECKAGEAGESIIRMNPEAPDQGTPTYYKNHDAAMKRRVSDVFKKGDLWFRSGDLMRLDAEGRLHFVDRLGDTFRWHSENVSTNEVADIIGKWPQIAETNVYGVIVPNADGRAGCVAIVPKRNEAGQALDWKGLAEHCLATLPRYAVPVFLRVVKELEHTGTMKLQKGTLRSEGVDLDRMEQAAKDRGEEVDQVYWLPPGSAVYVPFGKKELGELRQGRYRL
ncbi:putative fatty acid transporter protein [Eutypa lata UCREL1]|uniref:Putative fatty acid transporter protein n=1 Tax=Eutypa lata (strain UCR-EL1) TaxID=1287681 RepID=M7TMT3_EUTLA|nr:putative fatty acid transporter protein [Eutypa lata UCREL1]